MLNYKAVPFTPSRGRHLSAAPVNALTPPPMPDFLFTGYTGVPGVIEGALVLAVLGTASYLGITTGLNKKNASMQKAVGWVAGAGSALLGLLYLGTKTGVNDWAGLPTVRVSPV